MSAGFPLTAADLELMPDDGRRYELLEVERYQLVDDVPELRTVAYIGDELHSDVLPSFSYPVARIFANR